MKYKVWDIVVMKIMDTTSEWPHYTANMRVRFIDNPEVKIIDIIGEDRYYVRDHTGSSWQVLEKWIESGEGAVSYFIS